MNYDNLLMLEKICETNNEIIKSKKEILLEKKQDLKEVLMLEKATLTIIERERKSKFFLVGKLVNIFFLISSLIFNNILYFILTFVVILTVATKMEIKKQQRDLNIKELKRDLKILNKSKIKLENVTKKLEEEIRLSEQISFEINKEINKLKIENIKKEEKYNMSNLELLLYNEYIKVLNINNITDSDKYKKEFILYLIKKDDNNISDILRKFLDNYLEEDFSKQKIKK